MHIHRLEKIWLIIGVAMLVIFLGVLGVGAFAMGMQPPTGEHTIDPEKVSETYPFNNPGLEQIGDNEYNAYMVAFAFGFKPAKMEIPLGAKVHFQVTSYTYTFDKPGEYLVLCNEYCGAGHEFMATTIIVK